MNAHDRKIGRRCSWIVLALATGLLLAPGLGGDAAGAAGAGGRTGAADADTLVAAVRAPSQAEPATVDTAFAADTAAVETDSGVVAGAPARGGQDGREDLVRIREDLVLPAGEHCEDAVVVLGNAWIDGEVHGDAVAIGGTLTVNGTVHGQAVAIGGPLEVAPTAVIRKGTVTIAGPLRVAPGSCVAGERVQVGRVLGGLVSGVASWLAVCLFRGRLIAPELPWTVALAAAALAVALALAALFRSLYDQARRLTAQRPGMVALSGLLCGAAIGPLTIALIATVVGIALVPVLHLLLSVLLLVGLFAVLSQIGLPIVSGLIHRENVSPLVGGLVGAVLFLAAAMVPWLGLFVVLIAKLMGAGAGVAALIALARAGRHGAVAAPPPPPAAVAAASGEAPGPEPNAAPGPLAGIGAGPGLAMAAGPAAPAGPASPPGEPAPAAGACAGMWERLGAGLIDFLVVTLLASVTVRPVLSLFLRHGAEEPRRLDVLLLLVYLAVMWAWKQTTIGNTVFHLRVQRVDGSRLTAGVAVLRTCALLLSLVPLGLGFWWIAWDQRRQAWHDKIVGTQVLKVPAGVQLL